MRKNKQLGGGKGRIFGGAFQKREETLFKRELKDRQGESRKRDPQRRGNHLSKRPNGLDQHIWARTLLAGGGESGFGTGTKKREGGK